MAIGQRFDAYSPHDKRNTRSFVRSMGEFVRVTHLVDLMTRAILEDRNYRVVCANTGMEALAMFAAFSEEMSKVRVVLVDIGLPDF